MSEHKHPDVDYCEETKLRWYLALRGSDRPPADISTARWLLDIDPIARSNLSIGEISRYVEVVAIYGCPYCGHERQRSDSQWITDTLNQWQATLPNNISTPE